MYCYYYYEFQHTTETSFKDNPKTSIVALLYLNQSSSIRYGLCLNVFRASFWRIGFSRGHETSNLVKRSCFGKTGKIANIFLNNNPPPPQTATVKMRKRKPLVTDNRADTIDQFSLVNLVFNDAITGRLRVYISREKSSLPRENSVAPAYIPLMEL